MSASGSSTWASNPAETIRSSGSNDCTAGSTSERNALAYAASPDPAASGPSQLETEFESAAAASKALTKAPDNDALLALYSLYKQAGSGDATGDRPGALDMINRAKFDAWAARRGTSRDDAMKAYVELVSSLKASEATGK